MSRCPPAFLGALERVGRRQSGEEQKRKRERTDKNEKEEIINSKGYRRVNLHRRTRVEMRSGGVSPTAEATDA